MALLILLSCMYLMGLEKPTELAVLTFAVSCCADALWFNFIFNRRKK